MKQEKERVQTMNKQSFIEDRMKLEKVAIRLFDTKPKKPYNQGINELIEQRDQATEALRANVNKIQELNPTAAAQQPKGPVAKPSDSVGSRVENKAKAKPTPKPTPAPKKILLATPVAEAAKATPKVTPKKMGAGKAGLIGAGLTAGAIGAKKLYDDHQEKKVAFIEDRMTLEKMSMFERVDPTTGERVPDEEIARLTEEEAESFNAYANAAQQSELKEKELGRKGAIIGALGGATVGAALGSRNSLGRVGSAAVGGGLASIVGNQVGSFIPTDEKEQKREAQSVYKANNDSVNNYFANNDVYLKEAFIEDRMMLEKIANSAEEKYKAAKKDHQALVQRDFTKNMGTEIGLGIVGGMAGSGVDAVMRHKKGLSPKGGFGVAQLGGTVAGIAAGQSTAKGKEKKKDQKESLNKLNAAKKEWKQSKQAFIEDRMMLGKSAEFWIPNGGGSVRQEDDPQLFKLNDDARQSYANQKTLEKNLEQKQKTDANKGTLIGGASLSTVGSLVGGIKDKKPGAIAGGAVGALTGSILGRMIANESFGSRNRAMIDERDESRLVSLEKHNELLGYMDDNGYIVD